MGRVHAGMVAAGDLLRAAQGEGADVEEGIDRREGEQGEASGRPGPQAFVARRPA